MGRNHHHYENQPTAMLGDTQNRRVDVMLDPDKIYAKLIESGEEWADKDSAANLLEETKKTVLAKIMFTLDGSQAAREMVALATDDYERHLRSMIDARREANKAKVRYDAIKTLAELRRSQESTRRAEANIR